MFKKAIAALATAGVVALAVPTAEAAMMLRLSDGTTTVTVADEGAGDSAPGVGAVTFSGVIGNFSVNVTTGISKPVIGGTPPHMDLNSVNVVSNAGGVLMIWLTDQWSIPAPVSVRGDVGGTVNRGTVEYGLFSDASAFGNTNSILALGPFSTSPYSGTALGTINDASPFWLTLYSKVTFSGAGIVSYDYEVIPEPASLLLLGLGLVGAGAYSRRRR